MEFLDLAIHKHDFPMLPICYMLVCQRVSIKLSPEPPGSKSWEQERGGGGPESVRWRLRADTEGGEKPCGAQDSLRDPSNLEKLGAELSQKWWPNLSNWNWWNIRGSMIWSWENNESRKVVCFKIKVMPTIYGYGWGAQ